MLSLLLDSCEQTDEFGYFSIETVSAFGIFKRRFSACLCPNSKFIVERFLLG